MEIDVVASSMKMAKPTQLTFDEILQVLPQRPPFVMVDRILRLEKGKRIVATKNCSLGELVRIGAPISPRSLLFPESLISEAIGQAGIIFFKDALNKLKEDVTIYLSSVNSTFFRRVPVGRQLIIEIKPYKMTENAAILHGRASCENETVAEGEMSLACPKKT